MSEPDFWNNQEKAQVTMNEFKQINAAIKPIAELVKGAEDLGVMVEFAEMGEDVGADAVTLVASLHEQFAKAELQAMLSGPQDGNAAYVAVQSGEGGTDAQDFAEMLVRMYQRWAENRGFASELLDSSPAEEAGIHSATLIIRGPFIFGLLKGETGNHRLIRMSPFRTHRRPESDSGQLGLTGAWPNAGCTLLRDLCRN